MTGDLAVLTLAEAPAHIQSRQLSPVEYVEALIQRTETFDRSCTLMSPGRSTWRVTRPSVWSTRLLLLNTAGRCTGYRLG